MALQLDLRTGDLNWLFLTLVIVIGTVVLFYLFYFGRLFASIVSLVLRTILWRKYRAWVDIGSIQFSPLGGRFLFRDVRYVGQNQTVRIAMGHVTWRYWLWRVRQDDDLQKDDTRLPCRTTVKVEGLEWFVYNRGPAFDTLLEKMQKRDGEKEGGSSNAGSKSGHDNDASSVRILPAAKETPTQQDPAAIDWFREALPLEVQVQKGAVVLGNRSTPSLLVAGFNSALGTCGAVDSRSRYDYYKQVYQFNFVKPKIVFRKNHDYEGPIEEHGIRMEKAKTETSTDAPEETSFLGFLPFQDLLRRVTSFAEKVYDPRPYKPPTEWHGLPRYQTVVGALYHENDATQSHEQQYAKASTIYDSGDSMDLTYYADVPGPVPSNAELEKGRVGASFEKPDIGNGDLSPEWGIDVRLNGGTLTYGPWADRQRADVQKAFFPPGYFDSEPSPRLRPGDLRLHAALKIYIDFSQTTSLRLPTREASKDWKYDGMQDDRSIVDLGRRPYGWLDVRLGSNSSISFVLPMLAGPDDFDTFLEVQMDEISISSSVNYDSFLRSKVCRISCMLPQPLLWDTLHTWTINVNMEQPEVFLLRDHTFLLLDLVRDWTSGPPAGYDHFVPFVYKLQLTLHDYRLNLYLNERNIIDKAAIPQANTLLNMSGPRLQVGLDIPSITYSPPFSTIKVDVEAERISLSMNPPDWNTHAGFQTERTKIFGFVEKLNLSVSNTVFSEVHPDNVETLEIDMDIDGIKFLALGWVIKYLIELKDNYFGTFVHFVTPSEYRSKHAEGIQGDPVEEKYRPGKSDIFELVLSLTARNAIALLPQEIHDCESALALSLPAFGVHLRNHDYFMELAVNIEPAEFLFVDGCGPVLSQMQLPPSTSTNRWSLDGLAINAHRLFGPQPRTSVYVAVWDFKIGQLTADLTIPHVNALQRVARAFAANFADGDNALPKSHGLPTDPDITFLTASMEGLDATVWSLDTAVNIVLPNGFTLTLDDHAEDAWLSHIEAVVPEIHARGLLKPEDCSDDWLEVTALEAGLVLSLGTTATDAAEKQYRQKHFVAAQDAETRRCGLLYDDSKQVSITAISALFLPALASVAQSPDRTAFQSSNTRDLGYRRKTRVAKTSTQSYDTGNTTATLSTTYDSLLRRLRRARGGSTTQATDAPTFASTEAIYEGKPSALPSFSSKTYMRDREESYRPTLPDEGLKKVHINVYRPVRAVCSPAAVKVAQTIIGCLEKNVNVEHWLDDLEDGYLDKTTAEDRGPVPSSSLQAGLTVSSISLKLVQDALRPGDIDMPNQLEIEVPSDAAILSTAQFTIKAISATFLRSPMASSLLIGHHQQAIAISTGRIRLQVRHFVGENHVRPVRLLVDSIPGAQDGTVLDLVVQGLSGRVHLQSEECRVLAELHESNLAFVSAAAELITGTVHSWFIVSRAIEVTVLQAHYQPLWRYRHLFTEILQLARNEDIYSDPAFLNRPTVVTLQRRSELAWRVLVHARHCLRHLSQASKQSLQAHLSAETPVAEEVDFRAILPLLQEWYGWDLEKSQISQVHLFRHLFPSETLRINENEPYRSPLLEAASPDFAFSWDTAVKVQIATRSFASSFFEEERCRNRMVLKPCEAIASYGSRYGTDNIDFQTRITLGGLSIELDPTLLRLVRHVARVRKVFEAKLAPLIPRPQPAQRPQKAPSPTVTHKTRYPAPANLPIFASLLVNTIEITTQAQGVKATASIQSIHASIDPTLHLEQQGSVLSLDGSAFLGCDSIRLLVVTEAKSRRDGQKATPGSTLVSVQLQDLHTHAILRDLPDGRLKVQVTNIVHSSRIRIPRSILRMSQFVEHWRADSLPQSKIAFEELRRDLEKERPESPERPHIDESPTLPSRNILISVNLEVPLVNFHIRAAQKFWLDYTVGQILIHGNSDLGGHRLGSGQAGLRVGTQSVAFIAVSEVERLQESTPFAGENIKLPAFHGAVTLSDQQLDILASLERISVVLTVDVLDSVLAVQNRFEHDIDELLSVLAKRKSQKGKTLPNSGKTSRQESKPLLQWQARMALKGLNLGLRGPFTTQYIGADLVQAYIRQDLRSSESPEAVWEANASNLALSLAQETNIASPRLPHSKQQAAFDRSYRLAYFVLDVQAGNTASHVSELPVLADGSNASHLHVRLPKVHAVMQTAAIEALDELVEHFSTEIAIRREARAAELASIKEKVIQTLEMSDKPSTPPVIPWVERCVLSLRIDDVGIAIPLEDFEIDAPWFGHTMRHSNRIRPAFLLSTPSLLFAASKGNAGVARITSLSGQFVKTFDQTKPDHFSGLYHHTQNRLLFPMAQVTIDSDKASVQKMKAFTVQARMSGAQLDLDATIVSSVFALLDLYEISYKRFSKHAPAPETALPDGSPPREAATAETSDTPSFIDSTTFEASFVVDSGIINMHSSADLPQDSPEDNTRKPRKGGRPLPPRRGNSLVHKNSLGLQQYGTRASTMAADSFVIPKFTMWAIKREARQAGEQNNVHLDATIHSSRNTLYPTLLPFLSEAADAVKARMQASKPPDSPTEEKVARSFDIQSANAGDPEPAPGFQQSAIRNLRLTFSLQIDRSRLEISCLQAAQVAAVLNWQSGGLIIAVQPGSRKAEISARVDEVAFEIKHTFSPERCLGGSAQNLVLSLSFAPHTATRTLLSANFDASSINGEVNFRQLQDFLCFKAVWLDRLEQLVPAAPPNQPLPPEQVPIQAAQSGSTILITAVVARLQEIKLTCMLGQSIGTVDFTASHLLARVRHVPTESRALSVDLQSLKIASKGRLSGFYNTSGLYMESNFRDVGSDEAAPASSYIVLRAVIGEMDASLEFDYRKVLLLQSNPIQIGVSDDWSRMSSEARLQLLFSVRLGTVNVMATTQTVPTLVRLAEDLKRLVEDRSIRARGVLFGSSDLLPAIRPKSSKKALGEAPQARSLAATCVPSAIPEGTFVVGDIKLEAERLRLTVFWHHFTDHEAWLADVGSVSTHLERGVDSKGVVSRDLRMHLGFFSIRRLHPKKVSPVQERENTIQDWFDLLRVASDRNIFTAPTTEVSMVSTQADKSHEIHHRFSLRYIGQVDISLNWVMVAQLRELFHAYQDGMERIRQQDLRTAPSSPAVDTPPLALGRGDSSDDKDQSVSSVPASAIPDPPRVNTLGSFVYIAPEGGISIANPRVRTLGEATPPLDWLGVKQGLYPAWIHEGVTVTLEKILLELGAIYRSNLAKNASSSAEKP